MTVEATAGIKGNSNKKTGRFGCSTKFYTLEKRVRIKPGFLNRNTNDIWGHIILSWGGGGAVLCSVE